MPSIVRLKVEGHRRGWVALELDDGSTAHMRRDVFDERGFAVGGTLNSAELQAAEGESQLRHARAVAERYLRERPRSTREVSDRLAREGMSPYVIEQSITSLRRFGYLNDVEFARAWVETRIARRPKGRRLVAMELAQKGVATETVEALLDESYPDEVVVARTLAERRASSLRRLDKTTFRRRLTAYLLGRGFADETAAALVGELWSGTSPDADS